MFFKCFEQLLLVEKKALANSPSIFKMSHCYDTLIKCLQLSNPYNEKSCRQTTSISDPLKAEDVAKNHYANASNELESEAIDSKNNLAVELAQKMIK